MAKRGGWRVSTGVRLMAALLVIGLMIYGFSRLSQTVGMLAK